MRPSRAPSSARTPVTSFHSSRTPIRRQHWPEWGAKNVFDRLKRASGGSPRTSSSISLATRASFPSRRNRTRRLDRENQAAPPFRPIIFFRPNHRQPPPCTTPMATQSSSRSSPIQTSTALSPPEADPPFRPPLRSRCRGFLKSALTSVGGPPVPLCPRDGQDAGRNRHRCRYRIRAVSRPPPCPLSTWRLPGFPRFVQAVTRDQGSPMPTKPVPCRWV